MSTIKTRDGSNIFYKDWGQGRPVVFSHGWPLNADAWDEQLAFLASRGYRAVAHDRRGHGRSSQAWQGNEMDTYADDLAELVKELRLTDVILVGHASGGGEVARYVGRHGTKHVRKVVLVAAVPPLMLQTATNMEGPPIAAFDDLRIGLSSNRPQFYKGLGAAYYGADRPGAKVSPALLEQFWLLSMQAGLHGAYECIKAFSETDFTGDLRKFDVPTLVVHGDDDQIVPIHASALHSAELIKDATLKVYEGAPHGLTATHRDQFNADLLEFIEA